MLKPAARSLPITASWCRRFAGPGRLRDSIRPIAQRWRARTSRSEIARSRMAVFQSAPPEGRPISLKTTSTIASMRSSLLATWRYSAMGATSSISASVRMVSASSPPASACAIAAAAPAPCSGGGAAPLAASHACGHSHDSSVSRLGRYDLAAVDSVRRTRYRDTSYTRRVRRISDSLGELRPAMKAIVQDRYGSAEVLEARDIEKPEIGDDEVLVRVHAASVHVGDWILMTGSPYVMRMATGLRKPKNPVPGTDIAGTVEAVGKDVQGLRPGDEVFGWCTGAFAEYASPPRTSSCRSRPTSPSSRPPPSACPRPPRSSSCATTEGPARAEGADQRGVGRRRHVRRADRQGVRRRGDRRVQHEEPGAGPLDRRRPRHRLHPGGLHETAPSATTSSSTTSGTARWPTPGARSRRTGRCSPTAGDTRAASSAALIRAHARVHVRAPAGKTLRQDAEPRPTCSSSRSWSRPARSRRSSTAPTRWPRPEAIGHVAAGHARGTSVVTCHSQRHRFGKQDHHAPERSDRDRGSPANRHVPQTPSQERNTNDQGNRLPALHRRRARRRRRRNPAFGRLVAIANDVFVMNPDRSSPSGERARVVPAGSRRRRRPAPWRPDRRPRVLDRRPAEHRPAREQDLVPRHCSCSGSSASGSSR